MFRAILISRLLSISTVTRLNSTTEILRRNLPTVNSKDDDDDDHENFRKKHFSSEDLIFSDSKSARFKEKNKRKQKRWLKQLEERQILPQTPLAPFVEQKKDKSTKKEKENVEDKIVRDAYVTSDGIVKEDNFTMNFDIDKDGDERDVEPDEPVPLAADGRRYPVWYYAGKLKQLAAQNKVNETLDYFYNEMMDKERVAPNLFCYQVVIGICARNGYLTQAFDLYREMKDRGFTTVDSRKMTKIFTLLATACYHASDQNMAIDRARHFLDEMKEKGFRIEYRTYNALIAAFGKHGQIKMAFQLADEMVEVGFIPNEDTYASLLIACKSEKNAGFKYAIEIWRRMLAFEIKPMEFHFGLLLNITLNCGLGSEKSMNELLYPPNPFEFLLEEKKSNDNNTDVYRGPSFLSSISSNDETLQVVTSQTNNLMIEDNVASTVLTSEWWQDPEDVRKGSLLKNHLQPFSNANILKPNSTYNQSNLVDIRMPHSASERLMLLGGIPGILKHMQECNVIPNNIIFNSFLNLIPSVIEHEQALMHISNMCHIKPNLQFYNILILRRLRRGAKQDALQVLDLMREQCLSPDIYTFSALAKGCENRPDAEQLLYEMKELNLKPNQKILEAMMKNAFRRNNFPLLSLICESFKEHGLQAHKEFLERMETFLLGTRTKILAMEREKVDNEQYRLLSASYNRFQTYYNKWLSQVSYTKRLDKKISFVFSKPNLKN